MDCPVLSELKEKVIIFFYSGLFLGTSPNRQKKLLSVNKNTSTPPPHPVLADPLCFFFNPFLFA